MFLERTLIKPIPHGFFMYVGFTVRGGGKKYPPSWLVSERNELET